MERFAFGCFGLLPEKRLLLADDKPVTISARGFDILELLVRNHDRIVTREELVATVWAGLTVGENNLSVQMSHLRRALAAHGAPDVIRSIPGKGYRFVADLLPPEQLPSVIPLLARSERRIRIPRRIAMLTALTLATAAVMTLHVPRHPDDRLRIGIRPFEALGGSAPGGLDQAALLARLYQQTATSHLAMFQDLDLTVQAGPPSPGPTHFQLTGTVGIVGRQAMVTLAVLQAPDWREIDHASIQIDADQAFGEHRSSAADLADALRPAIFQAERSRRTHPPRDAMDYYIDAQVDAETADTPADFETCIGAVRQSLLRDPGFVAAKALLALLLARTLLLKPADTRHDEGVEALAMIDAALSRHPADNVFINYRALVKISMDQMDDARDTAERGLDVDPSYQPSKQIYAGILMARGDLGRAESLLHKLGVLPTDDRFATLALAQKRYPEAVDRFEAIFHASSPDWARPFSMLMEASALSRLQRTAEARRMVSDALARLPTEFRHVSAQYRPFYMLPDAAWQDFRQDIASAGMPD